MNQHVGSVLIIGNWNSGTAGVAAATSALQSYAPANNQLLMTTDQEGGLVQHLQGAGFDQMPSATDQGTMSTDQLRQSAAYGVPSLSRPASMSIWRRWWVR